MDRETVDAYWWKWWRSPLIPKAQEEAAFAMFELARDAYDATWPDEKYQNPHDRGACNEKPGQGENNGS